MTITVLIADDHPMVRQGLRAVLATAADVDVVGEADSGLEAVRLARELRPTVILMDLKMPPLHGVDATRQLSGDCPECAVLVITMFDDDDTVFAAVRAGATGYLLKGADSEEIIAAVRSAANGHAVFGPGIARRLRAWFASPPTSAIAPFPDLTDREREILDQLASGLTNAQIGERLHLATKTVANNVSIILNKLHVTQRGQAIVRARDAGLGQASASMDAPEDREAPPITGEPPWV